MKHLRKIIPLLVFSFLFVGVFSSHIKAASTSATILDDASLYSEQDIDNLNNQLMKISEKHNVEIVICTTKDLKGESASAYAHNIAVELQSDNKIVFLVSMDPTNHYMLLSADGACSDYITPARCDKVTAEVKAYFTNSDYYTGTQKLFDTVSTYLKKNPKLDAIYYQLWFQICVSLGIGLVIVLIMALTAGGKMTATQSTYLDRNRSAVLGKYDHYIRTEVTRTKRQSSSSGSGGSSGGGHSEGGSSF